MSVAVLSGQQKRSESLNAGRCIRLLVLAAMALLGMSARIEEPIAYWGITCAYGCYMLVPLLLGWRRILIPVAVSMLVDVAAVGTLIVLRGQQAQGLLVAVFTLMLLASVLEGIGTIFVNAIIVSIAFVALTRWGGSTPALSSLAMTSQVALFFVIAMLFGHAASHARAKTDSCRSSERRRARAQVALHGVSSNLEQSEARLRQAKESLRANERLCTLGMLAAGLAHEIKNPLASVAAGVEVVGEVVTELRESSAAVDPRTLQDLADAQAECEAACSLLARHALGLGDLSRVGTVQTDSVDIGETLDMASRMLRRSAGSDIFIQVEGSSERLAHADPGRILQVVLNLAKNAIDALSTQGGGRIVLSHHDVGTDEIALTVSDDGPGIPEALRSTMFDAFVTTKQPGAGTGLGLHLVSEIVASHQGSITYEPSVSTGARFCVRLPAATTTEGTPD